MIVKPMLSATVKDVNELKFPLLASPKIDGIRAFMRNGKLLSRTAKPIPNDHIRTTLEANLPEGIDGELVVGDTWSKCTSGIMTKTGKPEFTYYAFDCYSREPFIARYQEMFNYYNMPPITLLEQTLIKNVEDLLKFEECTLSQGHEGVMLRCPNGPYKFGRSTMREQYLMKLKRFTDAEAVVIGVEELLHNNNEQTVDELGYAKRSSHQANKTGAGMMGKLLVRGINGEFKDVEFAIGSGFTEQERINLWGEWEWGLDSVTNPLMGRVVKYKYFPIGCKDKPRHPIFLGWRKD